eukprot:scaffold101273_cov43-Attheya_sp.AAC.1
MGKKGKKSKKTGAAPKDGESNSRRPPAGTASEEFNHYLGGSNKTILGTAATNGSESAPLVKPKKLILPTPEMGWGQELVDAERAFKHDKTSVKCAIRLAHAHRTMRHWEELKHVSKAGLSISSAAAAAVSVSDSVSDIDTQQREQLKECLMDAEYHLSIQTIINDDEDKGMFKTMLQNAKHGKLDLDTCLIDHDNFSDLNALQYAAIMGDVRFLETLISLGAAIDYTENNKGPGKSAKSNSNSKQETKPVGATALTLAVMSLACDRIASKRFGLSSGGAMDGIRACAVTLVRLGAKVDVTLRLSNSKNQMSEISVLAKELKIVNKTVKEMAVLSEEKELIDAIEEMETSDEERIKLAYCRCGSRLPWSQCHYSEKRNDHPYHTEGKCKKQRSDFRFSPVGPCQCQNTKKEYFRCCWDDTRVYFMCDTTGEIHGYMKMPTNPMMTAAASILQKRDNAGANTLLEDMVAGQGSVSGDQRRAQVCEMLRDGGFQMMTSMDSPKSKLREWDGEVYAGVVERLDDWFMWKDVHYILAKPELLKRTKEWNDALEQYCDDVGLTGQVRRQVIEQHTANPLAPCANPSCNNFEEKVKSFPQCSRCKSVAYCSSQCQKEHWKCGTCLSHLSSLRVLQAPDNCQFDHQSNDDGEQKRSLSKAKNESNLESLTN